MKTKEEIKPNFAPVYACLYPELAKIFINNGYALAVHGSLANDFDLIAVPWAKKVNKPITVIRQIIKKYAFWLINKEPVKKNHGRVAYTISLQFGKAYLDISFLNKAL